MAHEQNGGHSDTLEVRRPVSTPCKLRRGIPHTGVHQGQNATVIRGLGAYHPGGEVFTFDETPHQLPTDGDGAGTDLRGQLQQLRSKVEQTPDAFVWLGLVDPTKAELALIHDFFHLESLQVEDAAHPHQRAKIDASDDGSVFAVLKTLGYDEKTGVMETGQVGIFTGQGYAITVRHGTHGSLTTVRRRLEQSKELRAHGSLAVLYAIMDMTVDGYLAVADAVSEDVGEVEADVFSVNPKPDVTRRIYELKRENMAARRAVHPLSQVAHDFADETFEAIPENLKPYFRDIGEHILRVNDSVEATDSLLMTMLMASTAMQDLQQNADTRKISAWVAIAAVPTVAGGIYGMNFSNMPELSWNWGYPAVLTVIAIACGLLYRGFKRNGWL